VIKLAEGDQVSPKMITFASLIIFGFQLPSVGKAHSSRHLLPRRASPTLYRACSWPAGAAQQFRSDYGTYVSSTNRLVPGDLIFFKRTTDETGITHIGIYVGADIIIAARSVRLSVRYVSLLDPFWSSRFVGGIKPHR
jgi:NlpC/P60 family